MPQNPIKTGKSGSPPLIKPILHALSRMQERETLEPDQLRERVRRLMEERFGIKPVPVESAFARGNAGLLAEHTSYFDGFAFMLPLEMGTSVAVRISDASESRIAFDGAPKPWTFDRTLPIEKNGAAHAPEWIRVLQEITYMYADADQQVEIAVTTTIPWCLFEGYLGALAMAATRAIQTLFSKPAEGKKPLAVTAAQYVSEALGTPYSVAYTLATDSSSRRDFIVVDAGTYEHLPVSAPSREVLGWGLIDLGTRKMRTAAQVQLRQEKTSDALEILRENGFANLQSLRDLDHQDLQRALNLLPRNFRGAFRFLVMENRRVQKMIFATRRNDWQMFGALLLMSHASRKNDWNGSNERADFVVEQVESMTIEGMYGASLVSNGGAVLVVGQPYAVPLCLDRIATAFEAHFGTAPQNYLL